MPNINSQFVVNITYCLKKAEFPPNTSMQLSVSTSSTEACSFHEDNQVSMLSPQIHSREEKQQRFYFPTSYWGTIILKGKAPNHRKIKIKTPNAFMENSTPRLTKGRLELYSPPVQQVRT